MNRFALTGIAAAFLLAGCATPLPTVSDQDIAAASDQGNLETVYNNYAVQLSDKDLNNPKGAEAKARLARIGNMLATKQTTDIHSDLTQNTLQSGLIPLPVIDRNIAKLTKMQTWDPAQYATVQKELAGDRDKTMTRITSQQQVLGTLTDADLAKRLSILDELGLLTGDPRYSKEHADTIASMQQRADTALKSDQNEDAIKALKALQQVNPNDKSISQQLIQANAKLFEKKFWDALAAGQLDDAYTQFMSLSQTQEFPEVMKRLSKSTDDMSSYFLAQAGNAITNNNLPVAYKLLGQARDIRLKTNPAAQASDPPPQQTTFLDLVFARYQAAAKAGQTGLAYGSLKVIDSFDPDYLNLRTLLRTTEDQVLSKAVPKVSTAAFTDPSGDTQMGGAVAARVTQRLFDKIPQDIKLIQRDQFDAILREQQLGTASKDNSNLVSADYLIQGKITESRVDTTKEQSKKTMRVVTDTVTVTNPDYTAWQALTDSQRKNNQEPAHTIQQDKKEDVTINVQVVRKVGLIAATFSLVEAKTGRVIATDTQTVQDEFTDQGNEGVDLGQFHLPFKLASLPSDTEILQKLGDKISLTIGDELVQQLSDPAGRYTTLAQSEADENNFGAATDHAAYALVMAQQNKADLTSYRKTLEVNSLKAPAPAGTAAP